MGTVSIRLDPNVHNDVKRIAAQQRRSVAQLARIWVEDAAAAERPPDTAQIPGQTAIPMDHR